jgi:CRP/FNR family transcriptional regulator
MMNNCLHCKDCDTKEHSFMSMASGDQLDFISEAKSCYTYKKGQTIFFEESRPLGLFCVNKGKIKIYKTGIDGKEQIIHFGQGGDFLGYRALIADEKYSVSATALEETTACFIPRDSFIEMLDNNPKLSRTLLKSLCHEIGIANERIQSMAQKNVRERLADTLLLLHHTFNEHNDENTLIDITLPREDIANIVGTATETLIRLLSEFKNDGLVKFEGKKIRLLDIAKLERLANP